MKVYLIDANALIYRIYHAMPKLTDPQGRPIQAVYGLANTLLKILKEEKPDYIFALYDRPEPTIRHQVFKEYKATRPPITDDLKLQISLSKKIFSAFNIPVIEKIGYEADDLIATLKEKFINLADEIIILTGDLDTLQLVDLKTKILTMQKGITKTMIYDENKVKEKYGLLPSQLPDYKALVGDPSDNIVGIPGIGPKTASRLLQNYQNLEGIITAAKEQKLDPKISLAILNNKEKLLFNRDLVTLRKNLDVEEKLLVPYQGYKEENLISVFQEFGFKSLIQRIKPTFGLFTPSLDKGEKMISLSELRHPFFFYLDQDKIKIYETEGQIKVLEKKFLKEVFFIEGEKFVFDLKNILKEIIKEDFYFDKKIALEKIYDLKLIFWLLNPDKGNYSLEKIISFFSEPNPLKITQDLILKLKELDLEKVYFELELPLTSVLARMELIGIKIDQNKIKELKSKCLIEIQNLKKEIESLAGMPFNPLSPKELNYILFQKLKLPSKGLAKTKKGEISTQESELLKIIDAHPIVPKILDYRKLVKVASTYTDSLLVSFDPKDGRVHPVYNQTGTSTGRLSSENPNVQNIPLKGELADLVREAFIAEEGFLFLGADYSQLELRLAAHLSQDENLLAAFKNNLDIHSQTAKLVFGEENLETRRLAKAINFGIIYGMQAKGLAERLRIPISQAQKIIERYFHFYPGLKKMREDLIEKAKIYGYAETLSGRKLSLPEIYSNSYREKSEAERIAVNMPIQGLGADIIKKAMIAIDRALYEEFIKEANLILSVHDELVLEVKEEKIDAISKIVKEKMEKAILLSLPLEVKIKEGRNLLEIKK